MFGRTDQQITDALWMHLKSWDTDEAFSGISNPRTRDVNATITSKL